MSWKHLFLSLLIFALGYLGILNVWNGWQFQINQYQLRSLERKQQATFEQNRRLQASITALSAPERLLLLIEQNPQWQLQRLQNNDITIIQVKE